jgi:hypothetical protein
MKKACFALMVFLIFVKTQYISAQQNTFFSMQDIINNSALNSGSISFEKKGIYCEYQYSDSLSMIRVLDFLNDKKEIIFFDTKSPDFIILGIRVGLTESRVKNILHDLGNPRIKQTEYGFDMEYVIGGYWLIIEFSESKVSRIYYNPFE